MARATPQDNYELAWQFQIVLKMETQTKKRNKRYANPIRVKQ